MDKATKRDFEAYTFDYDYISRDECGGLASDYVYADLDGPAARGHIEAPVSIARRIALVAAGANVWSVVIRKFHTDHWAYDTKLVYATSRGDAERRIRAWYEGLEDKSCYTFGDESTLCVVSAGRKDCIM